MRRLWDTNKHHFFHSDSELPFTVRITIRTILPREPLTARATCGTYAGLRTSKRPNNYLSLPSPSVRRYWILVLGWNFTYLLIGIWKLYWNSSIQPWRISHNAWMYLSKLFTPRTSRQPDIARTSLSCKTNVLAFEPLSTSNKNVSRPWRVN